MSRDGHFVVHLYSVFLFFGLCIMSDLTPTMFETSIDDTLAAVDAYSQQSATEPIDVSVEDMIRDMSPVYDTHELTDQEIQNLFVTQKESDSFQLNPTELRNGLLRVNQSFMSAISQMRAEAQSSMMQTHGLFNQVKATMLGVDSLITRCDISTMTGVGRMLSSLAGYDASQYLFTDISGIVSIGVNILKHATRCKLPNAYSLLAQGVVANSSPVTKQMLGDITSLIMPFVSANSSISMLKQIATGPVGRQISATNPNFLNTFASSYRLPAGTPVSDYPTIGQELNSAFSSYAPGWNTTTSRNGRIFANNNVYNSGSDDYRKVVNSTMNNASYPGYVQSTNYNIDTNGAYTGLTTSVSQQMPFPMSGVGSVPSRAPTAPTSPLNGFSFPTGLITGLSVIKNPTDILSKITGLGSLPVNSITKALNISGNTNPLSIVKTPADNQIFIKPNTDGSINVTSANVISVPITDIDTVVNDPLASTSMMATSDPLIHSGIAADFSNQFDMSCSLNGVPNPLMMDAGSSISQEFPETTFDIA